MSTCIHPLPLHPFIFHPTDARNCCCGTEAEEFRGRIKGLGFAFWKASCFNTNFVGRLLFSFAATSAWVVYWFWIVSVGYISWIGNSLLLWALRQWILPKMVETLEGRNIFHLTVLELRQILGAHQFICLWEGKVEITCRSVWAYEIRKYTDAGCGTGFVATRGEIKSLPLLIVFHFHSCFWIKDSRQFWLT